ncbi:MAG: membrane dipeptidase [Clostridia bacterium]|nr:membrane dipeptidase [Clostridia bacterium]
MKFFDLHCDTAYKCYRDGLSFCDSSLAVTPKKAHCFDDWYQCFAIFIKDGIKNPFEYYKNTLDNFKNQLKSKPDNLTPILTVEGGLLIEDDISRIETLYNDGVRALTLTWNGENRIAGGADTDAPLKDFGKQVIGELNRFGIATDLSHLNKKSFYGAIEIAEKPIITHSCLEIVNNHSRNIDDNQLKVLVQKGGIFGLCFYPLFLGEGDVYENIYKNIYHILDLGYEDYLSIGSDFDGADMSEKLYDISAVPTLYKYLKSQKIDENILNKIFFENAYNFFCKGKTK